MSALLGSVAILVSSVAAVLTVVFLYFKIEGNLVGINEDLAGINASLAEASTEIVARIAKLQLQVAAGEAADPALLAEIREAASALANIVPDTEDAGEAAAAVESTDGAVEA